MQIKLKADQNIIVTGPTGSGKTSLALNLARKYNGELINVDSRQIYKHLDIGTNKENIIFNGENYLLENIPIHLVNLINPDEQYDVVRFVTEAEQKIKEIKAAGKLPILVGGTGLYIDALVRGYIVQEGQIDEELRMRLNLMSVKELQRQIAPEVLEHLNRSDLNNPRRLIRLIERFGTPGQKTQKFGGNFAYEIFYLDIPFEEIETNLRKRVGVMWNKGIVEEVKKVLALGYTEDSTALQGIGYRQVLDFISGKIDEKECKELIYIAHRQYAKRQITWFKKYLILDERSGTKSTLQRILPDQLHSLLS